MRRQPTRSEPIVRPTSAAWSRCSRCSRSEPARRNAGSVNGQRSHSRIVAVQGCHGADRGHEGSSGLRCADRTGAGAVTDKPKVGETRIPLVEETVEIKKRVVETGRVQVRTFVDDEQVRITDTLQRENVDVERITIGREIDVAPGVREEGEFLIVPVVEERLVIEKRLFLVEEIRLRRTTVTIPVEADATRRVMRAEIERDGPNIIPGAK
ncbi:MAG: DUF2382 domain-containing protein [Oxalobacteraceae bacterium]|nr:MAG: DUF2382 domain-containing protein [Oxalobacteraceae bacterium]